MYSIATWILTEADVKKIEAFDMWIWRKILKIILSW